MLTTHTSKWAWLFTLAGSDTAWNHLNSSKTMHLFFVVNKMSFHLHAHVGIKVALPEHWVSLSGHPSRYLLGISQHTLKIDKTYKAHSRYNKHNSRPSTEKHERKIRQYMHVSYDCFLSSITGDEILDCYFGQYSRSNWNFFNVKFSIFHISWMNYFGRL